MPVVGTKGFVVAGTVGAMNVSRVGDRLVVALSPVEAIDDSLVIATAGRRLRATRVKRGPLQLYADTLPATGVDLATVTVTLGNHKLDLNGSPASVSLDRPIETPATFDWRSAYGLYLQGKELLRQREYDRATAYLDSALAREPHHVPALADRAALAIRAMQYEAGQSRIGKSLQEGHVIPVRSTYSTPLSVARSPSQGRPPLGCARRRGSSGATTAHSSSVTSGFMPAAIPPGYSGCETPS